MKHSVTFLKAVLVGYPADFGGLYRSDDLSGHGSLLSGYSGSGQERPFQVGAKALAPAGALAGPKMDDGTVPEVEEVVLEVKLDC